MQTVATVGAGATVPVVTQLLSVPPVAIATAAFRAVGATTAMAADVAVFVTTMPPVPTGGGSVAIFTAAGKRWTTQGGEEHGPHKPDKFINRLCRATSTHANREQATWHLRDSPSSFLSNQKEKNFN
uniref:Secreted protein n=1 Tax=Anopheles melas TaxID=34690 RepID=A0A182U0A7_9DIPT